MKACVKNAKNATETERFWCDYPMTDEQTLYFILGVAYAHAQEMKDGGILNDLSLDEIASLLIEEVIRNWREE